MDNEKIPRLGVVKTPDNHVKQLTHSLLEHRAAITDNSINDKLLKELVMKYVKMGHELRELNQLKNRFLGIAAHDLRNPLASIRGFSEMMLEMETTEEEKREYLRTIHSVSNQMLGLLNDLLDFSVIESGKFDLKLTPGNLGKLVEERVRLMAQNSKVKGIEITREIQETPEIKFDKDRLAQVVDNLLSNAVKFSKSGTTVHVLVEKGDLAVKIHVRDQGPGIAANEIGKLFGVFQKLSNQPTGGEKSTGLGMSIVKKIVDAHAGEISVESKVGVGTSFTVSLPLTRVASKDFSAERTRYENSNS